MSISNELISLREASKISGYHSDYLSFLIRSNKLKGNKVGHMWVVYKNDLENFLKKKEVHKSFSSNFFQKIGKVIFTTFIVVVFAIISFQAIKSSDSGVKVANNISSQNDF